MDKYESSDSEESRESEGSSESSSEMEKRESSDSESQDTENQSESDLSSSDESETRDWIWEKLVLLSCRDDKFSSFDLLKTYIRLHIDSQSNILLQTIMNDITMLSETYNIPLQKAIQIAVKMQEKSIIDAVDKCSEDDDSDDSFWCGLAELRGDLDCHWMTGESNDCTECNGMNMLETTSFFIKLFIDMGKDGLIEKIESGVEKIDSEEISLNEAINKVVNDQKNEILIAFREARKTIDACGSWNKNIFWQ